jgi:hypothetical protein
MEIGISVGLIEVQPGISGLPASSAYSLTQKLEAVESSEKSVMKHDTTGHLWEK